MGLRVAPVPPPDAQPVSNHPQREVARRYWLSVERGGVAVIPGAPGVVTGARPNRLRHLSRLYLAQVTKLSARKSARHRRDGFLLDSFRQRSDVGR